MVDLFIFDMGGVMAGSCPVLPRAAEALGVPVEKLRELVREDFDLLTLGRFDSAEFWRRLEARSGLVAKENYLSTAFAPRADPHMAAIARSLRSRGRVVCGTNTIDAHYAYHLAQGHYEPFDAVYASHLMGVAKPDPAFWRAILEAEHRTADRAVFIDDMLENVEAARSLGIDARLFTGAEELASSLLPARPL